MLPDRGALRSPPMMRSRLRFVAGMAACALGIVDAKAQQRRPASPLRLGVERLIADIGLAASLRRAFAAETGLAVAPVAGASSALLEVLERGELDAALTHAPAVEAKLEAQGLVHDRRLVARSDFVLVGPLERGKDPAGIAGLRDAAAALARIAQSGAPFLTLGDGSGTHLAEQALWRAAGVAPLAPWYQATDSQSGSTLMQARARRAYTLVDRASWLAAPVGKGALHGLLVEGDPRLVTEFHVQRSFRINHPAGKLFVAWLAGAQGRRVVARTRGLHAPR
jgi:tungstate transport system substrate-binding protein